MASSLRMAAPKMASVAAQSSVKVARSPMIKAQQLQKFTRAYSGTSIHPSIRCLLHLDNVHRR